MTRRLLFRKLLTTPKFFEVLAKHLDRIFPNGWIYQDIEEEDVVCAVDSTLGWQDALEKTCKELNISDVYEYSCSLDCDASDILDGDISELLCAVVYDENNQRANLFKAEF